MTRRTVLVVVVAVLISVVTAGTAIAAQPGAIGLAPASATQTAGPGELPENATNATDGLPAGVANFTNTTALGGTQVEPPSLAGKLRVESAYAANTSVELVRNSSTNFTLNVTVTGDAENVSFYLQETAFAASQNLSNVTAELDGEPLALGTTSKNNSSWIGFEIDHFSTRTVTFSLPAPDDALPTGVENFTNTTALRPTQAEPPSLAGKLRVESAYATNTSVELVRNSSTNFTLDINVTGDARNVSFYLQETAFAASQNLSNVTAELDGEPLAIGTTEANDSSWIGFEIDHFSTRTVTFDTAAPNGSDAANATGPPALPGQANAPIDTDGDGLYEDVTGDDEFSVLDVAVFLQNFDGETVTQNPASFDFNGDGDVSIIDVAALLDQLA